MLTGFSSNWGFSNNHQNYHALSIEDVALASLVCDDTIEPIEPDGGSKLLMRKEVERLTNEQVKRRFPGAAGVDCNMFMSQKVMPSKLAFRSGWDPGDMFMLVEAYVRHDPLNPTAILSLERHSSAFAEMAYEKFISRENAVRIEDLDGKATYLGKTNFRGKKALPTGWAGMETTVPDSGGASACRFLAPGLLERSEPHA